AASNSKPVMAISSPAITSSKPGPRPVWARAMPISPTCNSTSRFSFLDGMTTLVAPTESEPVSITDALVAEQRDLTAVLRFSNWHDSRSASPHEGDYRNLIPLSAPQPGEQYAFEVDLDKCS